MARYFSISRRSRSDTNTVLACPPLVISLDSLIWLLTVFESASNTSPIVSAAISPTLIPAWYDKMKAIRFRGACLVWATTARIRFCSWSVRTRACGMSKPHLILLHLFIIMFPGWKKVKRWMKPRVSAGFRRNLIFSGECEVFRKRPVSTFVWREVWRPGRTGRDRLQVAGQRV